MADRTVFPLNTPRLTLRPFTLEDAPALLRYRSLPEVYAYQMWQPDSLAEVRAFIRRILETELDTPGTWYQVGIALRDGGELIGDIGLHFLEPDALQMEIGYTLSPEHWGQGYAVEAVQAALTCCFCTLGKHRVSASVDPDNERSIRLLERLGFRREAHFRKSLRQGGRWLDDVVYAMLEEEWYGGDAPAA